MKSTWNNFFTTQFAGVLNDNLLKNLICFVAVYWAPADQKSNVIAIASATIVLPFILLSPLAGKIAQRHNKEKVFQIAKLVEFPIMIVASIGFYFSSLQLVFGSLLLMGAQTALYSPAKYGLIKELSGDSAVGAKLGTMEMLSFLGVLLGSVFAGLVADISNHQLAVITLILTSISFIGYLTSKKIKPTQQIENTPSQNQESGLESTSLNPVKFFITTFKNTKAFKGVNLSIIGLGSFWFIASMIQMNLLIHCSEQLHFTNSQTGLVSAFVAIGIGLGCFVSGKIARKRIEMGLLFFAALGLGISVYALSSTSLSPTAFIGTLMVMSFCGGLFKIPLNAWIQQRTPVNKLGNTLAFSNLTLFLFILLSSGVFSGLQSVFNSYDTFKFIGVVTLGISLFILLKTPVNVLRFFLLVLTKVIFKTRITGQENIPLDKGGILVCNHVSVLDALLILTAVPRNIRYVMHDKVYKHKLLNGFFKRCNMIPISSGRNKNGLAEFTLACKKEIEAGPIICIFPEGKLSRTGHIMPSKKGIEFILKETNATVYPMHLDNLVGTPLTFKTGTARQYRFAPSTLRKKAFLRIGLPITNATSAFELRQTIKELEVENIANRIAKKTSITAVNSLLKQVHRKGSGYPEIKQLDFSSLMINTPNYSIKDLWGDVQQHIGTKEDRIGQPIPGATVKVVSDSEQTLSTCETGRIFIKHSFDQCADWIETEYRGFIDECGFVKVTQ